MTTMCYKVWDGIFCAGCMCSRAQRWKKANQYFKQTAPPLLAPSLWVTLIRGMGEGKGEQLLQGLSQGDWGSRCISVQTLDRALISQVQFTMGCDGTESCLNFFKNTCKMHRSKCTVWVLTNVYTCVTSTTVNIEYFCPLGSSLLYLFRLYPDPPLIPRQQLFATNKEVFFKGTIGKNWFLHKIKNL